MGVMQLVVQLAQAFLRIGDGLDLADDLVLVVALPALQRGLEQGFTGREMPVEAALGHAEAAGEGFNGDGGQAAFGEGLEGGVFPVGRGEAGFGFGFGGVRVHPFSVPEAGGIENRVTARGDMISRHFKRMRIPYACVLTGRGSDTILVPVGPVALRFGRSPTGWAPTKRAKRRGP